MNMLEEIEQEGSDDSSDEDFNPAGCGNVSASEEESDGEASEGDGGEHSGEENGRKRRKGSRGPRKKRRNGKIAKADEEKEEEKENSEKVEPLNEEEKKKRSDSLWADFLRDCGPPAKKSQSIKTDTVPESQKSPIPSSQKTPSLTESKSTPEPKKITQVLKFAGEEVKVEKTVPEAVGKPVRRGGGLGSLLSQLGKGGKLSTLEKSKLDWESFKVKEGIKEDLEAHNKGKSGYLERQDFLTRTDARQFELEKQLRSQRRSLNR